jgi:hypothetical protein
MDINENKSSLGGKIFFSGFIGIFFCFGMFFLIFMSRELYHGLSTYFWQPVECTIVSSMVENSSNKSNYKLNVLYRYNIDGKTYSSRRLWLNYKGDSSYQDCYKLQQKYPAGSKKRCFVNPSNPKEAVFEHRVEWMLLPFMILPLIFVAIGGGGIYFTWRPKRKKEIISTEKENISGVIKLAVSVKRSFLIIFFLIFFIIGTGVFSFIFVVPVLKINEASKWEKTPCRVITSHVSSHHGSKKTTYSVDILYAYNYSGKEYRSNNYNFMKGSSSGYNSKKDIVRTYAPGAETHCYVNPQNPSEAVLNINYSSELLFGLIPLLFMIIGIVGIGYSLKSFFKNKKDFYDGYDAKNNDFTSDNYVAGETVATLENRPIVRLVFTLIFAAIWNSVCSIFIYQAIKSHLAGRPEWGMTLFMIPFVLVGIASVFGIVYCLLALFNNYPVITFSKYKVCPGEVFKVRWSFERTPKSIEKITIYLEGRKTVTDSKNRHTSIFQTIGGIETDDPVKIESGAIDFFIPEDARLSQQENPSIKWVLCFRGEIKFWPDIIGDYKFYVIE